MICAVALCGILPGFDGQTTQAAVSAAGRTEGTGVGSYDQEFSADFDSTISANTKLFYLFI